MLINSAQDLSGMALHIDTIPEHDIHSITESVDSTGSPRSYQSMSEDGRQYTAQSTPDFTGTDAGDFAAPFLALKP